MNRVIHNLIIVVTTGFLWQCSKGSGTDTSIKKRSSTTLAVEAVILQPQLLENKISATGTIIANEEVELKSEVSRKVTKIHFTESSSVKRGELLVKLDDRDLIAQLRKLK